jgi:hypothetical protein
MMSLLRIIFGVLVGIGFFVGLGFLCKWFPHFTLHAICLVMGCGLGSLCVFVIKLCLQKGVIEGGRWGRRCERSLNPISFWSHIVLYAFFAIISFAFAVASVLVPKFLALQ